jgi:hypothetical protein
MNQTQKRLKIINIAISITDIDTIQLQMLKLNQIKTDEKLTEILATLDNKNYAKAQSLITDYISQPTSDDIVQRVNESSIGDKKSEDTKLYKEIEKEEPIEIKLEDMLKIHQEAEQSFQENSNTPLDVDFDSLLNITTSDIKTQEIDLSASSIKNNDTDIKEITIETTHSQHEDYEAISYIRDKFQDMISNHPLKNPKFDYFDSVEKWLIQIEKQGYTEKDIEDMVQYIQDKSQEEPAEAAQLLLINASTKSFYAQFMFARELYKGNILEQNIQEAFDIMYDLAINENYPEAICDLAQFYEHGIVVKKDKKQALKLYEEAMQLGITRAMNNYDRLSKQKKGLFGLF